MKDVLLVGPYPPPYGGPNVHMLYLRRQLEERGAKCAVLNIGPSRRQEIDGAFPVRSGPDFVLKVARWTRRGYHVHHFFNVESPKAILLGVAAAVTTRVLGGVYSLGFVGGPRQKYLEDRGLWGQLFRVPLRLSQFVICNNSRVQQALEAMMPNSHKCHAIPSFHRAQVERVGEVPERVRSFLATHDPIVSSVVSWRGETADPYHEVALLIDAVGALRRSYPRLGCVLVGAADCASVHQDMISRAGLDEHFHFAGEVTHQDCLAVMRESTVFVRVYNRDGSSSSVREALSLLVPTVASRNPQHPPGAIQFEPGDGVSLAACLEDVLSRLNAVRERIAAADPGLEDDIERELSLFQPERGVAVR